jgi:valyl-tRNA synthetase
MLIQKSWPTAKEEYKDAKAEAEFQTLIDVISAIRKLRADQGVEPAKKVTVFIHSKKNAALLDADREHILRMANVETLTVDGKPAKHENAASAFLADTEVHLSLSGLFDPVKLKASLTKEQAELTKYVSSLSAKLQNKNFVDRAPKELVDGEKAKLAEAEDKLKKIEARLKQLA